MSLWSWLGMFSLSTVPNKAYREYVTTISNATSECTKDAHHSSSAPEYWVPLPSRMLQSTALHEAVRTRRWEIVNILLHHGMDPNLKFMLAFGSECPLPIVLSNRDAEITKLLLSSGADLSLALKNVEYASELKRDGVREMIDFLKTIDVDLSQASTDVQNHFICAAVSSTETEVIEELLNKGVDITAHYNSGQCPLARAIIERRCRQWEEQSSSNSEIISIFLEHLATRPGRSICCGYTLITSVSNGHPDLALELIERAAGDPHIAGLAKLFDEIAFEALVKGYTDIMDSLLAKGVTKTSVLQKSFLEHQYLDLSFIPAIERSFEIVLACDGYLAPDMKLLVASFLGDVEAVQQLMGNCEASLRHDLALAWAIRRDHIDVVKILRSYVGDESWAFIEVCRSGNHELLELFEDLSRTDVQLTTLLSTLRLKEISMKL